MKLLQLGMTMTAVIAVTQATPLAASSDAANDSPVLQYFELVPKVADPSRPDVPNFSIGKLLLSINSIRNVSLEADGKSITLVLNDADKQRFAELTHKYEGKLLFCQVSAKPLVGGIALISAPTEDGVIEFSEARYSGNIADYLHHRFWE